MNWTIPYDEEHGKPEWMNEQDVPAAIDDAMNRFKQILKNYGFEMKDTASIEYVAGFTQIIVDFSGKGSVHVRGNNVLYKTLTRFKKSPLFGHLVMKNGEETFHIMGLDSRYKPLDCVFSMSYPKEDSYEKSLLSAARILENGIKIFEEKLSQRILSK